ncbi:MAG: aldose 1-epimerase [Bryobacteraceae bacterium]
MSTAANYSADRIVVEGNEVIRLRDEATQTEVKIIPGFGNNAYEMTVKGHNVLYSPYKTVTEWKQKPAQAGNPFLAPWCNRISQDAYWANGKKYLLNADLKNFRKDANGKPIHGMLTFAEWQVTGVSADDRAAVTTSSLEFWRQPDWMSQFPFAHAYQMTHRLHDGVLEVETVVENLSSQPMPLSLGYHTYYKLDDAPRDGWNVHISARKHVELSNVLVPTGNTAAVPFSDPYSLRGNKLDDVFTELVRNAAGHAVFSVQGKSQKVSVEFGPNYPVSVIYAPPGREFICFEPMAGVTDVFNLAHEGKFPLQSVPAHGQWRESFWIRPSGF